jgi:hypothetical protein
LDHLCHLEKYYQDSTQETVFRKNEFWESYTQFTIQRHYFITCVANFQEDTLMVLETCNDVERWYEKAYRDMEWINYISVV